MNLESGLTQHDVMRPYPMSLDLCLRLLKLTSEPSEQKLSRAHPGSHKMNSSCC